VTPSDSLADLFRVSIPYLIAVGIAVCIVGSILLVTIWLNGGEIL